MSIYLKSINVSNLLDDANVAEDFAALQAALKAERNDDAPTPTAETIRTSYQHYRDNDRHALLWWTLYNDGKLIARCSLIANYLSDNRHVMGAAISVHPAYRRQGLAQRFLPKVLEFAQEHQRQLIFANSDSRIPAGACFAEHIGMTVGGRDSVSRLELATVPAHLLKEWQAYASLEAFNLGFWQGLYDPEDIEGTARLQDVMNDAPRDDLELEDRHVSTEDLERDQKEMEARGDSAWTAYARHKASGELAGYSCINFSHHRKDLLYQADTGVKPEYRGNRLGRALKAMMLERILKECPQAKRIQTLNASSNSYMLSINDALGFKLYTETIAWQLEIGTLQRYIKEKLL